MLKAKHKGLEFEIVEDNPDVGVYLNIYENGKCFRDDLQNDIATCMNIAFRDYGVPKDLWSEEPSPNPENRIEEQKKGRATGDRSG